MKPNNVVYISVFGHSEGTMNTFYKEKLSLLKERVTNHLLYLQKKHKNAIYLLLDDRTGATNSVIDVAIENKIPYSIYLYLANIEDYKKMLLTEQEKRLYYNIDNAHAIINCGLGLDMNDAVKYRDLQMIDESDFILSFWLGKRQGETYKALQYASKKKKIILDGMLEKLDLMDLNEKQK